MRILCPEAEGSGRTGAPRRQSDHWQVKNSLYDVMQGNFALAVSEGTCGGAPTSYYDLWRVESGKIAEQLGCDGSHCGCIHLAGSERPVLMVTDK